MPSNNLLSCLKLNSVLHSAHAKFPIFIPQYVAGLVSEDPLTTPPPSLEQDFREYNEYSRKG